MAEKEPETPETPPETPPTEETLAQEALAATEEETPPEVVALETVKSGLIDDITGLRAQRRSLAQPPPPQAPPPAEKSPLEREAERTGVPVDDVEWTTKLYRETKEWDGKQAEKANQNQQMTDFTRSAQVAEATLTDEVCGKGLGLSSLQAIGEHLLSDGDRMDIFRAGAKCGEEAIKKLRYRILEAGGANATVLTERVTAHKAKKKPSKPANPEPEPEPPSQEEVLGITEAHVSRVFDL